MGDDASTRLINFFLREIEAEERGGFARLSRIPDSYVVSQLRYYRSLGFEVRRPDRPLTLLIFRDEKPFFQIFRGASEYLGGVYSRENNRLVFYDLRTCLRSLEQTDDAAA